MTKSDGEATQAAGGRPESSYGGPSGLRRELGLLLLAGVAATILNRLLYQALGWPASSPMPGRTLVLVGALWLLMRARGDSFRTLGLRRPPSAARAVSVAVIFFLIKLSLLQPAKDWIRDALQLRPPDLSFLHGLEGDLGLYIFWLSVAVLAGGFGEELLFRGFLITRLEDPLGGNRAALVSAILIQAALFWFGPCLSRFWRGVDDFSRSVGFRGGLRPSWTQSLAFDRRPRNLGFLRNDPLLPWRRRALSGRSRLVLGKSPSIAV